MPQTAVTCRFKRPKRTPFQSGAPSIRSSHLLKGKASNSIKTKAPSAQIFPFGTPTNAQSWDYDAVGNWDSVTTNSTTQTRGANRQNEITSVSGATTPTYDSNGNLTKDENDNRFVWDAWNMMVQVKNSSNVVIVTYGRDALHRHVTDTVGSSVTDRFFSQEWQLLETKAGSNTVTRNVWSPAYVDALVLRDRDTDSNGTLDEQLYSLQDANWNTTGLVNSSGTIVERYTYSPFGVVTFRDASGAAISGSSKDWVFLHQGGEKIAAGDYEFRNRVYSPTLGRWLTNDPIGFSAGDVNTFRYVGNGPGNGVDSLGLERKDFLPNGGPNWSNEDEKRISATPSPVPTFNIIVGIISGGMISVGAPIISKPGYYTSFPWTSIGSVLIPKGNPLKFRVPTPVGPNIRYTIWPGRVVSRWLPYVGWALLAWDVINLAIENGQDDYNRYYGAWDKPDWYYFRGRLHNGNGQIMYGPGEGPGRK